MNAASPEPADHRGEPADAEALSHTVRGGVRPPRVAAPAISPWLAELMMRYGRPADLAPIGAIPMPPVIMPQPLPYWSIAAALVAIAGVVAWPELRPAYRAAYPSEPAKQQALAACSREDPSFIRFLPSARASCYDRYAVLLVGAAAAAGEPAR